MKKKTTVFQKTAIGLLTGLVLMCLLLIVPVAADVGEMVAWGRNSDGQATALPGSNYTQVCAGGYHSLALREDGTMVAWGRNSDGQAIAPSGNNYVQVSAGLYHNLALCEDGTVVAWGRNSDGQATAPSGNNYVQISAGRYHSLALREDGTMVAWGRNCDEQATALPGSNYAEVCAGGYHSLALREDGTVVAWGNNRFGQATAPSGSNYVQVSAGLYHNLALREDGSMVAWGQNNYGQATAPSGSNYVQVSAGLYHNLTLREDGTVVAWGDDRFGQATAPPGNDYVQVSAGLYHNLALITVTPAPVASITADLFCNEGSEICFDASGSSNTVAGTTYTWDYGDGTDGSGVNVGHTYGQNGDYDVILTVTNPDGQTDTATVSIVVANVAPAIDSFTVPVTVYVGTPVEAQAHFCDPGQDSHTATLNWGDSTGVDMDCIIDENTGNISGCHTYTASGDYQVTLTVTDTDGGLATRSAMIFIKDVATPEPTVPVNTPEFPTIAVPLMLIVGLAGAVVLARGRE